MNSELIRQALQDFLDVGTPGSFSAGDVDQNIRCKFSTIDSMACSFSDLVVKKRLPSDSQKLRDLCETLSKKLTYLLEPIQIIECDLELSTVQMRSNPPQEERQVRRYYELTATPDSLRLQRFEKQPDTERSAVDSVLTREVAVRLVDDLLS